MIEKIKDENEILTLTEELREERLTGECNDIQIWGKKVCKDCPLKDDKIFDNKSNTWYLNHWWDWVVDEYIININNKWVILSHMPIIDIRDWVYNIHWHYHDRLIKPISDYHKLYSPEKEDYELKELCNFI